LSANSRSYATVATGSTGSTKGIYRRISPSRSITASTTYSAGDAYAT
jgi:hypothetical protein